MSFIGKIFKRVSSADRDVSCSSQESAIDDALEEFQSLLGLRFGRQELLRQALTHRSATSGETNGGDQAESNERLEFLGDSVLGLVVNEHLFREYPDHREGLLTQMKSLLVSRAVLSVMARDMEVGRFLFLSPGEEESGGRDRSSILADAFEAVIGAIYLDRGMEAARAFISDRLMKNAREILKDKNHINYKSMLQEYIQSEKKIHPQYRVTSEEGPDHEKVFTVDVMVGKATLGRGKGKNKKQAQQEAARIALESMDLLSESPRGRSAGAESEIITQREPASNSHRGSPSRRHGRRRGRFTP